MAPLPPIEVAKVMALTPPTVIDFQSVDFSMWMALGMTILFLGMAIAALATLQERA